MGPAVTGTVLTDPAAMGPGPRGGTGSQGRGVWGLPVWGRSAARSLSWKAPEIFQVFVNGGTGYSLRWTGGRWG